MSIRFDDKVAVITGAGGGLGKSHALELARRGAKIVINDVGASPDGVGDSNAPAQMVADEIKAAGGEAIAHFSSISSKEGADSLIQSALDEWGRIDILINNAGILRDKSFAKMSLEDFQAVVDVHMWGTVYCTKAAWPHMAEQNYGRIVNTTSAAGLFGNFGQTNYGSAKMGVVGLMNSLKIEGKKFNITINTVAPVAATRLTEQLMPEDMKQALAPEAVTPAALYLCSEGAPTGIILQAVGGNFQRVAIVEGKGAFLGPKASVEDIAENFETICDLSQAQPKDSAL